MIIKNYPQFAKKTFFLGLDKQYFVIFTATQVPIYVLCMIYATVLFALAIIGASFIISVIAFAKNNYLLEKAVVRLALWLKYQDIKNILPR